MRTGQRIKEAIGTTLRMTWKAAQTGMDLRNLTVTFSGEGACMSKTNPTFGSVDVLVNLPDFRDDKAYSDDHADRIVAMALHEIGHGFFTDSNAWNDVVMANGSDPLLHRCINAFEDVRMEHALIASGYAAGSERLLTVLLQHMVKGCDVSTFKRIENVPFALCVDGRQYGVSVSHLQTKYAAIVSEAVNRCASLRTTADAALAGLWLWKELKQQGIKVGDKVRCKITGKIGTVKSIRKDIAEVV
jgi:hypothetical protein